MKTDFGTGALKITPGHDPNDFEIGRRHGLEELTVIGEDGRMTEAAGEPTPGLTVVEAPRARRRGAARAGPAPRDASPTRTRVPFSHRSGERIEPLISLQWFMRMDELAAPGDRGRPRRPRADPSRAQRAALPRLAGEHPPVVHLAPALVGPPAPRSGTAATRPTSGDDAARGRGLGRATPTCSTRGSRSALWPFATLGWPDDTPELRAFYPTDVLSTARDILFLWVARMVMMGLEFTGDVPFARRLRATRSSRRRTGAG